MKVIIQNLSNIPIYQQIYEQIKEEIISGKLQQGELLPSIRQLSRELKISVITTTRAYTDLENDGYITIIQGKGCFVKEINPNILEERLMSEIKTHFTEIWKCAKLLKKNNEEILEMIKILMEDLNDE